MWPKSTSPSHVGLMCAFSCRSVPNRIPCNTPLQMSCAVNAFNIQKLARVIIANKIFTHQASESLGRESPCEQFLLVLSVMLHDAARRLQFTSHPSGFRPCHFSLSIQHVIDPEGKRPASMNILKAVHSVGR